MVMTFIRPMLVSRTSEDSRRYLALIGHTSRIVPRMYVFGDWLCAGKYHETPRVFGFSIGIAL